MAPYRLSFTPSCFSSTCEPLEYVSLCSQPKGLKKIVIERGGAWYVTITPLEWDKGAEFCVAMRILVSIPQERGKPKTGTHHDTLRNTRRLAEHFFVAIFLWSTIFGGCSSHENLTLYAPSLPLSLSLSLSLDGLSSLSVMHWNYIYKSAGWTITPEPVVGMMS